MAGMDIAEAARRVGVLAWTERRLFEAVGGWVATTPEHDAKLLFARTSRLHGDHVVALAGVLPDTRDHDPDELLAPGADDVTGALDGADTTLDRLAALVEQILPAQVGALEAFVAETSAVRDGPARRVAGQVLDDDRAILDEMVVVRATR